MLDVSLPARVSESLGSREFLDLVAVFPKIPIVIRYTGYAGHGQPSFGQGPWGPLVLLLPVYQQIVGVGVREISRCESDDEPEEIVFAAIVHLSVEFEGLPIQLEVAVEDRGIGGVHLRDGLSVARHFPASLVHLCGS